MFGQNAASLAHKHGNSHLYSLLEQADISRHPKNPVIKFYLSSFDIADDDSSDSETEEYLDLLKENNFMNLPDENGQTILFHAIIHEDVEFVSFLCQQKQYLNVALRDLNEKSVFDYINQIKNPVTRIKLSEQLHSYGRKKAWISVQADHGFF